MAKRICIIDGCERSVVGRGLCSMHWKRWYRYGDPLHVQRIIGDQQARFESKVDRAGPVPEHRPDLGPCALWLASTNEHGYGTFGVGKASKLAHRVAYEMEVGTIPEGCELDHLCRRRACVRTSHLDPVPHAVNVERGDGGRNMRAVTHCPQGHPYDSENTRLYRGRRHCRACARESTRRWKAKQR